MSRMGSMLQASRMLCLAVGIAFGSGGCTVIHKQYDQRLPEAGTLQPGRTHYRDVLAACGPPAKLSALDEQLVFLYEQAALTERQLGVNLELMGMTLFKLVYGRGHARRQVAMLTFDEAGELQAVGWDDHTESLGSGVSLQFIVALVSVTDSAGLDDVPTSHYWGASLLASELSEGLNRHSDPGSGTAGLEQKGTPHAAGQRTLELRSPRSE